MIFVDLCSLIFFTISKILTESSISICSIEFDKAMNIPVRPTPALACNNFKSINIHVHDRVVVMKETVNSTGKHLQWHLLLGQVAGLYEKGQPSPVFSVNFNKFFRSPFYRIPISNCFCKLKLR